MSAFSNRLCKFVPGLVHAGLRHKLVVDSLNARIDFNPQAPTDSLLISASLQTRAEAKGGRKWLASMQESSALMNSVLSVIHPKLFWAGLQTMKRIGAENQFREIVALWESVFNGMQVLSNRETPLHRDNNTLVQ